MGIFSLIYKAMAHPTEKETEHYEFMRLRLEIEDAESAGEFETPAVSFARARQRLLLPHLTPEQQEYHSEYIQTLAIQRWEHSSSV